MDKTAAASNQNIYYQNLDLNYNRTVACAKLATDDIATVKIRVTAVATMIISAIGETMRNAILSPGAAFIGMVNYGIQLHNYLTTKIVTIETEKKADLIPSETDTASKIVAKELISQAQESGLKIIVEETSSQVVSEPSSEIAEEMRGNLAIEELSQAERAQSPVPIEELTGTLHLDQLFEPTQVEETKDDVEEKTFELDEASDSNEEPEKFIVSKGFDTMIVNTAKFFRSWRKAS